jgi:hypothetical protein
MQDLASSWFAPAARWLLDYGLLGPLAQLLLATLFGFLFAERWQRWRQRREFQYRTLVKFSELSYEMMDRLSELLMARGRMRPDVYADKRREFVSRWIALMSTRGEVMACFGRRFLLREEYQGLFNALKVLRGYVAAPEPIPRLRFEPEQEKFLAYREAVVADMVRAMGLVSKRQHLAEKRAWQARVQEANAAATTTETADTVGEGTPRE